MNEPLLLPQGWPIWQVSSAIFALRPFWLQKINKKIRSSGRLAIGRVRSTAAAALLSASTGIPPGSGHDLQSDTDTAMTMDSRQIRHKNFKKLFEDFVDCHPHEPRRGMLKLFAEHLGLSDRYLSHIKCNRKNIGNHVARTIEQRLKLPHGWMDREHNAFHMPTDDKEKLFVETALSLFRAQPHEARELMLDLLREKLHVLNHPPADNKVSSSTASPLETLA